MDKLKNYYNDIYENKLLVKMPEREDDHLTPATRLLEKRREMTEVETALAAQKEEFQMKMESLQQRKQELERKENQLKESLLKFDKFLMENESKRGRAIKKADYERELKKLKDKEIRRLMDETDVLLQNKTRLQKKMEKNIGFQKYLFKSVESTEEFHEIREIIARHVTLTATREQLMENEQKNQEKVEQLKQELHKYKEEKNNEILNYNNQLAGLQTTLDSTQSRAVKLESKWTRIENTAAQKTLLLGKTKIATHNLYQLVQNHQKMQTDEVEVENTSEQLITIQQFIQDITEITTEIRRMGNVAMSIGDTSS